MPLELKHLVPYKKVKNHLTWRDIVIGLQMHDGGPHITIKYRAKEQRSYQNIENVEFFPDLVLAKQIVQLLMKIVYTIQSLHYRMLNRCIM